MDDFWGIPIFEKLNIMYIYIKFIYIYINEHIEYFVFLPDTDTWYIPVPTWRYEHKYTVNTCGMSVTYLRIDFTHQCKSIPSRTKRPA